MDINVRAFRIVRAAISESEPPDKRKESSRKGGLKGGPARAEATTKARRSEIARMASKARWHNGDSLKPSEE